MPETLHAKLPRGLCIHDSVDDQGPSIWSTKILQRGTTFGPKGYTADQKQSSSRQTDSRAWMKYITETKCSKQHNILPFLLAGKIYYRTIKEIERNTKLLIWYGAKCNCPLHMEDESSEEEDLSTYGDSVGGEREDDMPEDNTCNPNVDNNGEFSADKLNLFIKSEVTLEHENVRDSGKGSVEEQTEKDFPINDQDCHENVDFHINDQDCHEAVEVSPETEIVNDEDFGESVKSNKAEVKKSRRKKSKGNQDKQMKVCPECNKTFKETTHLRNHMLIHSGVKAHRCDTCGRCFGRAGTLKDHQKVHSGERPYVCVTCSKTFTKSSNLRAHVRSHTGIKPYKCTECRKSFTYSSDLNRHIRMHNGEQTPSEAKRGLRRFQQEIKCLCCGEGFYYIRELIKHVKTHQQDKEHLCLSCGLYFDSPEGLSVHTAEHVRDRPHHCLTCGKSYTTAQDLRVHTRIHTGDKEYKCDMCGKEFLRLAHLHRHSRVHTGDKPHLCTICAKEFSESANLMAHMRIHSGERPHICKTCGKSFTMSNALTKHTRTHTNERPYPCTVCGKKFRQSGQLDIHRRTHSGIKPYSCETCGAMFAQSGNLYTHIRKAHRRENEVCLWESPISPVIGQIPEETTDVQYSQIAIMIPGSVTITFADSYCIDPTGSIDTSGNLPSVDISSFLGSDNIEVTVPPSDSVF